MAHSAPLGSAISCPHKNRPWQTPGPVRVSQRKYPYCGVIGGSCAKSSGPSASMLVSWDAG